MIWVAPAARAPKMADNPTPPNPTTKMVSPNFSAAVLTTAPTPVMTAQPNKAAISKGMSELIFTKESTEATEYSAKPDIPK